MKIKDEITLTLDSALLNLIFNQTNAYDIKQVLRRKLNELQNPPPEMSITIERKYIFYGVCKTTGKVVKGDLYHNKDSGIFITYYDDYGNYYENEVIPESVGLVKRGGENA